MDARLACILAAMATMAATAQVPDTVAQRLRELGNVIEVPQTLGLYDARVREAEPYAGVVVERDIPYGDAPRHLLDVFRAFDHHSATRPVLLFVHGGAFVAGNRRLRPDSPFYDNVMLWAARNGMVGVSMTYRLAPDAPWPGGAADIGRAVSWVRANILNRGGDPSRIYLLGHSAGASLAAAYIAHAALHPDGGPGVAGAMLLSGVYEITPELVTKSPTYSKFYGDDPAAYPARSSVSGLAATPVKLWVGRAELDPPQFREQAALLREALCARRGCVPSGDLQRHTHMSQILSFGSGDRTVSDFVLEFVR